jgi:hypothetical protein
LKAAVTPPAATGSVEFLDGTLVVGVATLSAGTAEFITIALSAGPHSLSALYSGEKGA